MTLLNNSQNKTQERDIALTLEKRPAVANHGDGKFEKERCLALQRVCYTVMIT